MGKWNKGPDFLKRTEGTKGIPRDSFLIVCEGEKTEPFYFQQFKVPSVELVIEGTGKNTISLVNHALELKAKAAQNGDSFDQVWCVFDRDSFPLSHFNEAISKAQLNNIKVAYSNESFEIWFILHFEFLQSGLDRSAYQGKLSSHLKRPYTKNDSALYQDLIGLQGTAIRNARNLLKSYNPPDPGRNNPVTRVFELVEELNKYI